MDNTHRPRRHPAPLFRGRLSGSSSRPRVVERPTRRRPAGARPRPDRLLSRIGRPALGPGDDRGRPGRLAGRRGRRDDRPRPGRRGGRRPGPRPRRLGSSGSTTCSSTPASTSCPRPSIELLRGETKSFHLGPEVSTLEIGIARPTTRTLDRVERRANAIVFENREIKTYFVPEERIGEVPLRRPPKVSGLIRVVEVDGFRLFGLRRDALPADGRDRADQDHQGRAHPGQPPLRVRLRRPGPPRL